VTCDVSDESSVRALGREARARVGHVDVIVNNAGVATSGPFHKLSLDEWNRVMAVHATGTFLCAREFAPDMIERGWGRIVNIASVAGLAGARYVAHYSAAKHAVVGFTRSAGLELEGTGVTIHAVCPAYVDTPMTEQTVATVRARTGLSREQALAAVLATTGQPRLVTTAEVADAVLALCGGDAAARNGTAIVLDAGATTS
jgi:NAD(P)-dependent dehydrogenase (short-subunit alcohol dehydrogenase family)